MSLQDINITFSFSFNWASLHLYMIWTEISISAATT